MLSKASNNSRVSKPKRRLLCSEKSARSNKNGPRNTIYWVKPQHRHEDGTLLKNTKWRTSTTYNGSWKDNKKHGFGVQIYGNGDKYEGMWSENMRHGSGTLWILTKKNGILRKLYTGDWSGDKMEGRGTMYFENGDKYEGMWKENLRFGKGKLVYNDGDVYIGQWNLDKRCGYGCLFKSTGDQFEGMWLDGKREGKGSYFFKETGKMIVGEWVDDRPKCVVYSEMDEIDEVQEQIHLLQQSRPGRDASPEQPLKCSAFGNQRAEDLTCFEEIIKERQSVKVCQDYRNPSLNSSAHFRGAQSRIFKNKENISTRTEFSNQANRMKSIVKEENRQYRLPKLFLKSPIGVLVDQIEEIRRQRRLFRILKMPLNMMFTKEQLTWLNEEFAKKQADGTKVSFWDFFEVMRSVDPDLDSRICFNAIQSIVSLEEVGLDFSHFEDAEQEQEEEFWLNFTKMRNSRGWFGVIGRKEEGRAGGGLLQAERRDSRNEVFDRASGQGHCPHHGVAPGRRRPA